MGNKRSLNVLKYLLGAVDAGYIEGVNCLQCTSSKIILKVEVRDVYRVNPVMDMIEANVYTNETIRGSRYKVERIKSLTAGLRLTPCNRDAYDLSYDILVEAKRR